jgi:adenosine deaminase
VALGLGGPEEGHPAQRFASHFAVARSRQLPANPHAGEGMGPQSVRETMDQLLPTRIGHGVRAIEDPLLVRELAAQALPLEVCLTSNLRLGVYASYAEHPLKRLIEAGCVVSLNTDDPVLFQTSLTQEYLHALQDCGLTLDQLKTTVLQALQVSYLGATEKQALVADFRSQLARLDRLLSASGAPQP